MTPPVAAPAVRLNSLVATCLTGLGLGLAGEVGWRWMALRIFDVTDDLPALQATALVVSAVLPVLGNGVGYFVSFRRPSQRSRLLFLGPSFLLTCLGLSIALAQLPGSFAIQDVVVTVIVVLITPITVVALLLVRLDPEVGQRTA